jgi:hypothetical protein
MLNKNLSPAMRIVLLTADKDGWIPKSSAPCNTAVALMDRGLISKTVRHRDHDSYFPGHYLTKDGHVKVAELRGETTPTAEASEIRAGDFIEIRQPGKRRWAMRVERLSPNGWQGTQIRMTDGREGRTRFTGELKPGEYTIIERLANGAARPVVRAAESPRPARVTATVADDDNVPVLSKAQIDGLHWIGAPKSTPGRERYGRSGESPGVVTVKVLERYGLALLSPYRLTDAGRAAYLVHKPTGRLSKPFNDAWRAAWHAAKDAANEPDALADAAEAACDRREVEIDEANEPERPELPTLDDLLVQVYEYGTARVDGSSVRVHHSGGAHTRLNNIRRTLEALYREAGR